MVGRNISKVGEDRQHLSLWMAATTNGWAATEPTERDGPSGPSVNAQDSEPRPIDQMGVTAPEAAFAWDQEIRIAEKDRVAVSIAPTFDIKRHQTAIITGASLLALLALGLTLVWIGGPNSDFLGINPAALPLKQVNSSVYTPPAKSDRLEVPGSPTNPTPTATGIGRAHQTSKSGSQTTSVSLSTKQNPNAPGPTAVQRTNVSTRPVAVPETRPTTIEGWTIREVNGGTAVLEGPNGTWKATRGDTVPGVGKIDSIVRWGNRWIVATSRGLISTR
jgi:hypothetical protein